MATTHFLRPFLLRRCAAVASTARIMPTTSAFTTRRAFSIAPIHHEGLRKYTHDHEYLHLHSPTTSPRIATIGITAHAASSLGDIVFIELPTSSSVLTAGDPLGTVESVKSASDIISPVSGKVVEVNQALADRPGLLNVETAEVVGEGGGWICRVEIAGEEVGEGLMSAEEYEAFTKGSDINRHE
ncbi:glycine cleavage system H protein [Terfezia boudieri ATCC MYA-4762]|uniref:Glycine cleavage system H protein n=1 Tax=Terfezia boudieri ATCC MYA-4762 TaxID=1051890 RepID=A0A3N4MQ71_9PEZI|nr:glycine cleavage system H protein [Terfezia boudieri ATCC MYA-4762]